jgi:Domain of unknown function (DUF1707)
MTTAPRSFPAGNLRASDADRDRALAELADAYQAGRLDSEEFDERSGKALQAKTGQELADLFTDLPAGQSGPWIDPSVAAGQPHQPRLAQVAPGPVTRPAAGTIAPILRAVTAIAIVTVIFGAAVDHRGGSHWAGVAIPLLIALFVVRRIARTRR